MNRLLAILFLCAACKHSTSSSSTSHSETSTVTDSTSSETGTQTTVTTTSEAPGKTTTTVEEYGPPEEATPPEGPAAPGQPRTGDLSRPEPPSLTTPEQGRSTKLSYRADRSVPAQGPLVKRTVTVTEHGAETSETHQQASTQAQGATETKAQGKVDTTAKAQSESKPAASCIGASWLWGAAVLAGIVGVLYFAIKMRKSVP